jgi:hypothetical protein
MFMALPALAPLPAAAFRTEEATFEFLADLEDTCAARDTAHESIRATLEKISRGEKLAAEEWRRLSTCPFCRCQVAFAPPAPPSGTAR